MLSNGQTIHLRGPALRQLFVLSLPPHQSVLHRQLDGAIVLPDAVLGNGSHPARSQRALRPYLRGDMDLFVKIPHSNHLRIFRASAGMFFELIGFDLI